MLLSVSFLVSSNQSNWGMDSRGDQLDATLPVELGAGGGDDRRGILVTETVRLGDCASWLRVPVPSDSEK